MPRLKQVLPQATTAHGEAHGVVDLSVEQLFSESIHSQKLAHIRKQAAAKCAATPIRMSALVDDTSRYECTHAAPKLCGLSGTTRYRHSPHLWLAKRAVHAIRIACSIHSHGSRFSSERVDASQHANTSCLEVRRVFSSRLLEQATSVYYSC